MAIWEAPQEIKSIVEQVKSNHHPHLALAGVWVLINDGKCIKDNKVVYTTARRCTKTEKLKTGHDFKITIMAEAWSTLTDPQREIQVDEALCHCGVKYVPQTIKVNGKDQVIKDEIGRTIFTDEIDTDGDGNPKWKINTLDVGTYFALLQRHHVYNDEIQNVLNALNGVPLKKPSAAIQAPVDTPVEQEVEPESKPQEAQVEVAVENTPTPPANPGDRVINV